MILFDTHTHTGFSSDSEEAPENQIDKAIELGLKGICITDHMDYLYPQNSEYSFTIPVDEYVCCLQDLREKYSDRIKVLYGIELGLRNERNIRAEIKDYYDELLKADFDFVIGSTHVSREMDPYYPEWWQGLTKEQGLSEFFIAILENTRYYSNYDTVAHIDYITRYWPGQDKAYSPADYMDIFDEILKQIISSGKALECNTSGFKYGLDQTHPHRDILKRYRELGGELITIGSDAHKTLHIANCFDKAEELLQSAGFRYYSVFEGRKPVQLKLG